MRDGLAGSVYPQQCRVCAGAVESYDDGVVCRPCWLDPKITVLNASPICPKCGILLPGTNEANQSRSCGTCESFPFSIARASASYFGSIEASLIHLKSEPRICRRLREIIITTYRASSADLVADAVMPVPLHRLRERERGFNQARLIAQLIARANRLELDDRSLVRVKVTERHRAGLDRTDRAKSVERAFEVTRPEQVRGASILLVDDVFTTGSTISAAARALLDAGAARVVVFTIARVVRSGPLLIW